MNQPRHYLLRWKGQQLGPFTQEDIEQKVRDHELSLAHEVHTDGKWRSLRGFFELQTRGQEQQYQQQQLEWTQGELARKEAALEERQLHLKSTKDKLTEVGRGRWFSATAAQMPPPHSPHDALISSSTDPDTQTTNVDYWTALTKSNRVPVVSIAVASACVVVFLLMLSSGGSLFEPTTEQIVHWGGNDSALIVSGQWWRLITSCFVHVGVIHLAMNMWCLCALGTMTEKFYGRVRFSVLYILAGIGGSIAGCLFHPATVSAGASGAIFGLAGGTLALCVCLKERLPAERFISQITSMLAFVCYNLFYGFAKPHIDNAAHIGGLVTGFAVGLPLAASIRTKLLADVCHQYKPAGAKGLNGLIVS